MRRILLSVLMLTSIMFAQGSYSFYNPTFWNKSGNNYYYTGGYLSLGTTTAFAPLAVSGSVYPTLFVERQTTSITGGALSTTTGIITSVYLNPYNTVSQVTDGFGTAISFGLNDLGTSSTTGFGRIAFRRDGGDSAAAFQVFTGNLGNTPRLTIRENGYTGLNTTAPTRTFEVNGSIKGDSILYTTLVNLSDIELKHSITPVSWDVSKFNEVIPIKFKYKREAYPNVEDSTALYLSEIEHTGFSAQEFNGKIVGNNSKQIDLMQINVALWLKVQELETRIKALENK